MRVHEIFDSFQGEGYFSGSPCTFVRFFGCPVGCSWCDTGYGDDPNPSLSFSSMEISEITEKVNKPLAVLTGGEPFYQDLLPDLCLSIAATDRRVAIETSGVCWMEVPDDVWITLSPKDHATRKNLRTDDRFWERANEIKIVVATLSDLHQYIPIIQNLNKPIFLQPCDTGQGLDRGFSVIKDALEMFPHFRYSLQTHKILKIR